MSFYKQATFKNRSGQLVQPVLSEVFSRTCDELFFWFNHPACLIEQT